MPAIQEHRKSYFETVDGIDANPNQDWFDSNDPTRQDLFKQYGAEMKKFSETTLARILSQYGVKPEDIDNLNLNHPNPTDPGYVYAPRELLSQIDSTNDVFKSHQDATGKGGYKKAWDEFVWETQKEAAILESAYKLDREAIGLDILTRLRNDPNQSQLTNDTRYQQLANAQAGLASGSTSEKDFDDAVNAAKKLLSEEGREQKEADNAAHVKINEILNDRQDTANTPGLHPNQKAQLVNGKGILQELFNNKLQTELGLSAAQALIVVQLMLLKLDKTNPNSVVEYIPKSEEGISEFERLMIRLNKGEIDVASEAWTNNLDDHRRAPVADPSNNDAMRLVNCIIEIREFAKMLKDNPRITDIKDLIPNLEDGNPNHNTQTTTTIDHDKALKDAEDLLKISVDPNIDSSILAASTDWAKLTAKKQTRIMSVPVRGRYTQSKIKTAAGNWEAGLDAGIADITTKFDNAERPYLAAYQAWIDGMINDPAKDGITGVTAADKQAWANNQISDAATKFKEAKAKAIHDFTTGNYVKHDATHKTESVDSVDNDKSRKILATSGFLKNWNKFTIDGPWYSPKKFGGNIIKGLMLMPVVLPVSALAVGSAIALGATAPIWGIGALSGAAGAALLARGSARGLITAKINSLNSAPIKIDKQNNQFRYAHDKKGKVIIDPATGQPIDRYESMSPEQFAQARVQYDKSKGFSHNQRRTALDTAIGTAAGALGAIGLGWLAHNFLGWGGGGGTPPPPPGGNNIATGSGHANAAPVGGKANNLIQPSGGGNYVVPTEFNMPPGGSIIRNMISKTPGVSDAHASRAYEYIVNIHGGDTAAAEKWFESITTGHNQYYAGGQNIGVGVNNSGLLEITQQGASEIHDAIVATK